VKILRLWTVAKLGETIYQEPCGLHFLFRGTLSPSHSCCQLAQIVENGNGKSLTFGGVEFCGSRWWRGAVQGLLPSFFGFRAKWCRCDVPMFIYGSMVEKVRNFLIEMEITGGRFSVRRTFFHQHLCWVPVRRHGLHPGDGITGIHTANLQGTQAGPGPAPPRLPAAPG